MYALREEESLCDTESIEEQIEKVFDYQPDNP